MSWEAVPLWVGHLMTEPVALLLFASPRLVSRPQFGEPAYWHLFAGEPWHGGFASQMAAAGFAALDFEKQHGLRVDFHVPTVRSLLFLAAGDLGLCLGAVLGPPCRSFSEAADRPCLRPAHDPMGLVDPPPEWREYIVRENVLIVLQATSALACTPETWTGWWRIQLILAIRHRRYTVGGEPMRRHCSPPPSSCGWRKTQQPWCMSFLSVSWEHCGGSSRASWPVSGWP